MRAITLAGTPRFLSRSAALLKMCQQRLKQRGVSRNRHNVAPEDLLYARFDSAALLAVGYALKPVLNAPKAQEVLHGVFADDRQISHYERTSEPSPLLNRRVDDASETFWSALTRRHQPFSVAM